MTQDDLNILESNINGRVRIETTDGEHLVVKVLSVFAEESDADMFFELVSTSRPELYKKTEHVGGYALPLKDIALVSKDE